MCMQSDGAMRGIQLEALTILLVNVAMYSHSGYEYMGLVPRLPLTLRSRGLVFLQSLCISVQTTRAAVMSVNRQK